MKQILITSAILILTSCGNQNKVKMSSRTKEKVGTIVLVTTKIKSEYEQSRVIELSEKIDPMVDEFDGYLGRKMAFSAQDASLLVDVVYYTNDKVADDAAEKEMKSEVCNRFFECMNYETLRQFNFAPIIMSDPKKGIVKTIELVLFKTKPEYSNETVIKRAEKVNAVLDKYDGYISRKLAITEDGQWMDLVYWTNQESAEKASKDILENQLGQEYFDVIDMNTIETTHLNVVIDTER